MFVREAIPTKGNRMLNINEQIKIATELENEYKNSHELGIPLDKEQISPQNKPRIVNLFMP